MPKLLTDDITMNAWMGTRGIYTIKGKEVNEEGGFGTVAGEGAARSYKSVNF